MNSPLPTAGDVVHVRQRRWLVSDVTLGEGRYQSNLVPSPAGTNPAPATPDRLTAVDLTPQAYKAAQEQTA